MNKLRTRSRVFLRHVSELGELEMLLFPVFARHSRKEGKVIYTRALVLAQLDTRAERQ